MAIVEIKDIQKTYTQGRLNIQALGGVDLTIDKGEFVAIAGPSGSGKTTLLNIMGGLDMPDQGRVMVDNHAFTKMNQASLASLRLHKIGFVFQAYNLIPVLSAIENVEYVMLLQGVPKTERQDRAKAILDDVGLEGRVTGYGETSYFQPVGTGMGLDGASSARLTDKITISDNLYVEAHYEAALKFGDTHKKQANLGKKFPALFRALSSDAWDIDKRRVFDLTKTSKETDDYILWNRLDRLFVSLKLSWGDIMAGRQAVTWGNGMIFNPMDLFNPFSPSDILRDYKMGDNLVC